MRRHQVAEAGGDAAVVAGRPWQTDDISKLRWFRATWEGRPGQPELRCIRHGLLSRPLTRTPATSRRLLNQLWLNYVMGKSK